jgi:hypothetical protein
MDPRSLFVAGGWRQWKRTLVSAVLFALGAAGCGTTYEDHVIEPGQVYDGEPLVTPLPLAVGVYYPPEFRDYESHASRSNDRRVDRYHLRLGPASVALFDRILAAQFAEVRPVDRLPAPDDGEADLDAVIEVSFASAGLMSVGYDLTLYAASGTVIAKFDADGATYSDRVDDETVSRGLRVAMRNAAAKFLVDFPDNPDVHAWLSGLGRREPLAMGSLLRREPEPE